ncbi:cysteine protease, partial [Elasticomyces elasticus]
MSLLDLHDEDATVNHPVIPPSSTSSLSPQSSLGLSTIDGHHQEFQKLQRSIAAASSKDEALGLAVAAAELSMKALKLARSPDDKRIIGDRARSLLAEAEKIKRNGDWRRLALPPSTPVEPPHPPDDVKKIKVLKQPSSTRQPSKAEQILLMKASFLNGFKFPPWTASPDASVFALREGEEPFLDEPALHLSPLQREVFDGWKRAADALPPPSWFPDDHQHFGPTMLFDRKIDLVQDAATDCSVVASLCAGIARAERGHAKILSAVLHPYDFEKGRPMISPNGKYIVRLNFNGCYRLVQIDDRLPVSKTSRTLHVIDRLNPSLLWPALVEKAYLKIRGGYDFPGSNSGTDLWIFTGWIPEQVFLQSHDIIPNQIWKRIFSAYQYGDVLMTMGTGKISNHMERQVGLAGEHDYAILGLREIGDHKLILIKNPWCEGTSWRGTINLTPESDAGQSDSVTPPELDDDGEGPMTARQLLNSNDQLTPGTFWMDLNSVVQHFESIYLNWNPGLFTHREDLHFSWDLSPPSAFSSHRTNSFSSHPQFAISTEKGGTLWVLLCRHFQNAPSTSDSSTIGAGRHEVELTGFISLYAFDDDGKRVYLSDGAIERGPYVDSPQTLLRLDGLEPNRPYTMVPAEQELTPTAHTFSLFTFSSSAISISPAAAKYPHSTSATSAWTAETAGGNAHSPTYALNPQFALTLPRPARLSLLLQTPADGVSVH